MALDSCLDSIFGINITFERMKRRIFSQHVSDRPFYMTMEIVSQIRRGETISARLLLVNNQDIEVLALVVLPNSPDYR